MPSDLNQLNPSFSSAQQPLHIVCVYDDRVGHKKQLEALADKLNALRDLKIDWVYYANTLAFGRSINAKPSLPGHIICIGAGRKTHRPMLRLARQLKAMRCTLMAPQLPHFLFDAIICPRHDQQKESKRLLNTQGPLVKKEECAIEDNKEHNNRHNKELLHNLILLGGESKHYHWNDTLLMQQVQQLTELDPHLPWRILSSRRTPETSLRALQQIAPLSPNSPTQSEHPNPVIFEQDYDLATALKYARQIWVTPDSSNMLYEAISTGKPTGVFELSPKHTLWHKDKLAQEIERLSTDKRIMRLDMLTSPDALDDEHIRAYQNLDINEAERAAHWLLARHNDWQTSKGLHKPHKGDK